MGEAVDPQALGLAGGVLWSAAVFVLAIGATYVSSWQPAVAWLGQYYLGYAASVTGSIIGTVWGFFDVFIGLYAFAWLYNYFRDNPVF